MLKDGFTPEAIDKLTGENVDSINEIHLEVIKVGGFIDDDWKKDSIEEFWLQQKRYENRVESLLERNTLIAEGREAEKIATVNHLHRKGHKPEDISELMDLDVEWVKSVLDTT
ncbi:hypothetical protein DT065_11340 [Salicibibacter kimchii]|uniref:Uncharacterized protein n=2 Tax=Salicibibacter kimchii TaxID=2099786 RepID=A0A345C026_9BACI|nr:hypothetical protein DT065_11340 [Salicibibacter kimchii]